MKELFQLFFVKKKTLELSGGELIHFWIQCLNRFAMDFDKIDEGYTDGEKPLHFYYNREERIKNAPKIVQDFYAGKVNQFTRNPFKILLNRESGKAVRLSTNELNRIQLRCTGYTEEYGPEWDIHSYSVPAKSDIEVIRI